MSRVTSSGGDESLTLVRAREVKRDWRVRAVGASAVAVGICTSLGLCACLRLASHPSRLCAPAQDNKYAHIKFPSPRARDVFLARLRYLLFESTTPRGSAPSPFPIYLTPKYLGPTLSVFCTTWNCGESAAPNEEDVRAALSRFHVSIGGGR